MPSSRLLVVYIQFLMAEPETIICARSDEDRNVPSLSNIGSTHHMDYYCAFAYMHNQNETIAYMQPGDGRIFSACTLPQDHRQFLSMLGDLDFQPFTTGYYGLQEAEISDGRVL